MGVPIGEEKKLQVGKGFSIKMIIGEYDYEPDLHSIRIISSFSSAYPIFVFSMSIKPIEMIRNDLLGGDIIELSIEWTDFDNSVFHDPFNVDLLYLSGDYDIPTSNQLLDKEESLQDQKSFTIKAIPLQAYRVMTFNINRIYNNKSPFFILADLVSTLIDNIADNDTGFHLEMDNNGGNHTEVDQIILPPTVFKNHCDYLFNEYGVYNGFGLLYASIGKTSDFYDKNIEYNIINITDRWLHGDKTFKIVQIANDEEDTDKIIENYKNSEIIGSDDFFIHTSINTNYVANSVFSTIGVDNYFVHKPIDKFYRIDNVETDSYMNPIYESSKGEEPYLGVGVYNRKRYISNHICYNRDVENHPQQPLKEDEDPIQDEYWLSSRIFKNTFTMSRIDLSIHQDFKLHKLTDIGRPVLFESRTNEYEKLNGRYIFFSSDITLNRSQGGWKSSADISLTRPNWCDLLKLVS